MVVVYIGQFSLIRLRLEHRPMGSKRKSTHHGNIYESTLQAGGAAHTKDLRQLQSEYF